MLCVALTCCFYRCNLIFMVQTTNKDYWDLITWRTNMTMKGPGSETSCTRLELLWDEMVELKLRWCEKTKMEKEVLYSKWKWMQWQLIQWKGDDFAQAYMDAAMTRISERWHQLHIKKNKPFDIFASVTWYNARKIFIAIILHSTASFEISLIENWLDTGNGNSWKTAWTSIIADIEGCKNERRNNI